MSDFEAEGPVSGRVVGVVGLLILFVPLVAYHLRKAHEATRRRDVITRHARAGNLIVVGGVGITALIVGDDIRRFLPAIVLLILLPLVVIVWAGLKYRKSERMP